MTTLIIEILKEISEVAQIRNQQLKQGAQTNPSILFLVPMSEEAPMKRYPHCCHSCISLTESTWNGVFPNSTCKYLISSSPSLILHSITSCF
jgi:hypothetical protein